ncbi:tyrosine-type recombinase/integrase [Desulfobaculum senezii]
MKLTNLAVKNARQKEKNYKLTDGRGLYVLVTTTGSKLWRMKYHYGGKEKLLAFGQYPEVSLLEARERHSEARKLLRDGIDPSVARKRIQQEAKAETATLEAVSREWLQKHLRDKHARHGKNIIDRLEKNIFPWLGNTPIKDITPPLLLECLQRIESRGAITVAHRVRGICGQVFSYALATGLVERNPAVDLKGALPPIRKRHFPTITDPRKIGELMRAIHNYKGEIVTCSALKLAPLVFVRPGELRHAEWTEFNFDDAEWRIPGKKMKTRNEHIVPLSRQALHILLDIYPLTNSSNYVFPSLRSNGRPMSDATINAALRRLGYTKDEFTGHSFRSMASTRLNELGWSTDAIERQLAHIEQNKVRAAYNRAEHLDIRRQMMQFWADHLDELRTTIPKRI